MEDEEARLGSGDVFLASGEICGMDSSKLGCVARFEFQNLARLRVFICMRWA
jgi:hypothetical protein